MDIKEVISSFENERKFLLKDLSEYKFTMTEILINQLLRIKSITRVLRELKSNNKEILKNYEKEKEDILSEIENEKIPLPQNFLEPIHRLKIIKNVLDMSGENKINNKDYIG
jgi:anion-transporting  ArsA/GET3 family ATPase